MSDFAKEINTDPGADPTRGHGPKCPHCLAQPCMIAMAVVSMGMGAMTGIFICQACEKVLSCAPLPSINLPEEPRRVVVPAGKM